MQKTNEHCFLLGSNARCFLVVCVATDARCAQHRRMVCQQAHVVQLTQLFKVRGLLHSATLLSATYISLQGLDFFVQRYCMQSEENIVTKSPFF